MLQETLQQQYHSQCSHDCLPLHIEKHTIDKRTSRQDKNILRTIMQPFADEKKIKTTQNLLLSINEKWKS